MSQDGWGKVCDKCSGPTLNKNTYCVDCIRQAAGINQLQKEIADKHVPKVVRPTQEPLYEKRG